MILKTFIVNPNEEGQTIEKFVKRKLEDAPLSFIYKIFRKKDVKINSIRVGLKEKVYANDKVEIYLNEKQYEDFRNKEMISQSNELEKYIVYEDDNILVVNKPSGLLVSRNVNNGIDLNQLVKQYFFYKNPDADPSAFTIAPAHRIDRNTSGLIIFGKNVKTMQELLDIFKNHEEIEKHYLTIVNGKITKSGIIDKPLLKDADTGIVRVASIKEGAKTAISEYKPLEVYNNFTLLDVKIITGRTHQIRVHMASIGHSVIGDPKYGDFKVNKELEKDIKLTSQFLHSYQINFKIKRKDSFLSYLNNVKLIADLSNEEKKILDYIKHK